MSADDHTGCGHAILTWQKRFDNRDDRLTHIRDAARRVTEVYYEPWWRWGRSHRLRVAMHGLDAALKVWGDR